MKTDMTNEEVDAAIKKHGLPRGVQHEVHSVRGFLYRSSQANSEADAYEKRAFRYMEECSSYHSACDSLDNMAQVAELLDHKSSQEDIRIRLIVNEAELPECFLADYSTELARYLFRTYSK